jgi:hypothetical protein
VALADWITALCAATALFIAPLAAAASGPVPPCAGSPVPPYAALGQPPAIAIFHRSDLADWRPDACAHFRAVRPALVVAVAGRFAAPVDRDSVLARFAAISRQRAIRYWSVTDRRWQPLVTAAEALSGPRLALHRADFSVVELTARQDLYFAQQDNRSSAPVVYRLRVRDMTPRGFLVETENVTPVRYLVMQVYGVGDLHTLFFIESTGDGVWNYYGVNEIGNESHLFAASDESYVNRAAALFRFFAGLPTDLEPPAMR